MGTTFGYPGTWNDKSLVLFDELIKSAHNCELMEDKEFDFFELDANRNVVLINTFSHGRFLKTRLNEKP